jgi:phosphatidylserine decarboxylase
MNDKTYETVDMFQKEKLGISFLYKTLPGRVCLKMLIRPTLSRFCGFLMDRRISTFLVKRFIKKNEIDMNEYKKTKFMSFNDFFTREVKDGLRVIPENPDELTAPCDGKMTAFRIEHNSIFNIKGSAYTVEGLLQDKTLADEYAGGLCLIYRLMPDDYHRYCYIDEGEITAVKKIKGVLHTVRPVALNKYRIYKQNAREYAVLETENYGKVVQMEVGALFVGRIRNHKTKGKVERGEERGMFEFGGSTVVMLFKKDTVKIDDVILSNTALYKETVVKMGNVVGGRVTPL